MTVFLAFYLAYLGILPDTNSDILCRILRGMFSVILLIGILFGIYSGILLYLASCISSSILSGMSSDMFFFCGLSYDIIFGFVSAGRQLMEMRHSLN